MNVLQSIVEALQSLSMNKLRSGLTILGIVIGVAAVIALMSLGQGVTDSITGSIQGAGSSLIYVSALDRTATLRNPKSLVLKDATALADPYSAPDVAAVAPILSGMVYAVAGSNAEGVTFTGTTADYATVASETVTEGSFITDEQVSSRSLVVVIGTETAETLFGRTYSVVGQKIRLNGQQFKVTGLLTSNGTNDDRIIVPITTAQSRLTRRWTTGAVDSIEILATSSETVERAEAEVTAIMRDRHDLAADADNDFKVYTSEAMVEMATSIITILTYFLGGIAGISLLVGGIGIMNIMLVSVTERTREIGLRKALGARRSDILFQFLIESALLSLAGGAIGVGLGYLISIGVAQIAAAAGTDITPTIGIGTIFLATSFSTIIGLFFGFYPANRASSLQPVEALRYE